VRAVAPRVTQVQPVLANDVDGGQRAGDGVEAGRKDERIEIMAAAGCLQSRGPPRPPVIGVSRRLTSETFLRLNIS